MEHAKLLVHRGAARVTRAELADIEAPPATATWKPIPHATLVTPFEELTHRNIAVVQEDYAVQRKNSMLFGVMVLNYLQTEEFAAALAFRHANDMSEAVKMYAGVRVFNCDNMSLSGDEIILHKKHSPRFQLAAACLRPSTSTSTGPYSSSATLMNSKAPCAPTSTPKK